MDRLRQRVVRVITRLNVGGPAQHVVWLTAALNDDEFESVLVTGVVPAGEQDMTAFAAAHQVRPIILEQMSRELSVSDLVTTWKLYRLFVRHRPHIVHTHTAKAGTVGRVAGMLYRYLTPGILAGRPRRCAFVHTYHGHIFHSYYGALKTRLFLMIERLLARLNTDRIIVLSAQQMREIHETFRIGRPEQFRIIPLGVDLSRAVTTPSSGGASNNRQLSVAIVGRLTAIKNHDLFLRVASRLRDSARFVIYGDGAERERLEQQASSLGLQTAVTFAGTRPPAEIYGSIDIAALTSFNEGTPLMLIEALANGIPAISTAVGGVVDILGDVVERVADNEAVYEIRQRGITAAPDDERGFASGLRRLLDDPQLRRHLSAQGRQYAHATYTKERLVADIIALYRELRAAIPSEE